LADWMRAREPDLSMRYVITSKKVTGCHTTTLDIQGMKNRRRVAYAAFKLEIPPSAQKLMPGNPRPDEFPAFQARRSKVDHCIKRIGVLLLGLSYFIGSFCLELRANNSPFRACRAIVLHRRGHRRRPLTPMSYRRPSRQGPSGGALSGGLLLAAHAAFRRTDFGPQKIHSATANRSRLGGFGWALGKLSSAPVD